MNNTTIFLINPNTLTCPSFRTYQDAEITKKIYQQVPVLENEATGVNPWGISFMRMFDMSNDSHLFRNEPGENLLPLYEAKMFHIYNHRFASAEPPKSEQGIRGSSEKFSEEDLKNIQLSVSPRYFVDKQEVENNVKKQEWLLAVRKITGVVSSFLPKVALSDSATLIFLESQEIIVNSCFLANFNSLVFDYVARQKVGGVNLNFFILKQLPIIPPESYTPQDIEYIGKRVLELTYTAWDMKPFAEDMGYHGDPFIWDENRRAILRAELDAKYAKLYGLIRDELRYILDPADVYGPDFPSETFRVLKNNEIKKYGEYRTQRLVLAAWDMMGY